MHTVKDMIRPGRVRLCWLPLWQLWTSKVQWPAPECSLSLMHRHQFHSRHCTKSWEYQILGYMQQTVLLAQHATQGPETSGGLQRLMVVIVKFPDVVLLVDPMRPVLCKCPESPLHRHSLTHPVADNHITWHSN